ncbi:ankyrin repeat-containing protein, partial [Reticulomyxa filosa]
EEKTKARIEEEIKKKRVFEDALFSGDFAGHPEWVIEKTTNAPSPQKQRIRTDHIESTEFDQSSQGNNMASISKLFKLKNTFTTTMSDSNNNHTFKHSNGNTNTNININANTNANTNTNANANAIDPSNPHQRQISFMRKFNTLSSSAREKLTVLFYFILFCF